MVLTLQQLEKVQQGEALRIIVPEISSECVLVRGDVYDRVEALLATVETDPREALPLVHEVMREDDAADPLLESYQQYRREAS